MITYMQLELKRIRRGTKAGGGSDKPGSFSSLLLTLSSSFLNIQLGGEHLEGHYYKDRMEK